MTIDEAIYKAEIMRGWMLAIDKKDKRAAALDVLIKIAAKSNKNREDVKL